MQSSNRKLDSKKSTTDSLNLDLSNQYQIFIANPVICIRSILFTLKKITKESLFLEPVGILAVGFNLGMCFELQYSLGTQFLVKIAIVLLNCGRNNSCIPGNWFD